MRHVPIFLALSVLCFCSPTPQRSQSGSATTSASATIRVGDTVTLGWQDGGSSSWMALDDAAWDELNAAIYAKDRLGVQSLVDAGRAVEIASADETGAVVLASKVGAYRVRIQGGPHQGVAGWVYREFVHR